MNILENDFLEKIVYSLFFSGSLLILYSVIILHTIPSSNLWSFFKFIGIFSFFFLMLLFSLEHFFKRKMNYNKIIITSLFIQILLFSIEIKFPISMTDFYYKQLSQMTPRFNELSLEGNPEVLWKDENHTIINNETHLVYIYDESSIISISLDSI